MTATSLKKLVFRKELSLVKELVNAIDPLISVQSVEGQMLFGQATTATDHRYPIYLEEQLIGWVNGSDQRAEVVASLLSHLAYRELEKRTLAQELLSKYKEVSLLFNISEKLIDSLDIQEVASLVLEEARRVLNSDNGGLMLLTDGTNLLEPIVSFGDGFSFKDSIQLGEGILGSIIATGRGEIINDVLSDPRHLIGRGRMNSILCVPLKNKEKVIGAIALSRSQLQAYKAEDLKLLTTLACQAAGVISALLHERKLKESRQNDLIFRLSSQIRDSLELMVILETAVSEIYNVLHLDRCLFLWYQTEARLAKQPLTQPIADLIGGLEVVTEVNSPRLLPLKGTHPPHVVGTLARQFLRKEPIRIQDIHSLNDPVSRQFLQSHQFSALLAIPIQTFTGHIGAICCGMSREARVWTDDEIVLLQSVTNQLAIALDQADLYEQSCLAAANAQAKAQELEEAMRELRNTQAQLVQSEKMSSLGQLVAGIAHEINNPVNFIHGNVAYAKSYVQDLLDLVQLYQTEFSQPTIAIQEKVEELDLEFLTTDLLKLLQSMQIGTDRIREIVRSLRVFSRLDEAEVKAVDIHEGIDSTLMILQNRLKAKPGLTAIEVVKEYSELPMIECYSGQLNQVFMNILVNSIDALDEQRNNNPLIKPKITINTKLINQDELRVSIADNGCGIPIEIQKHIFDPFFTTKPVGQGTGMGMSISYQIITEKHQGKLYCISSPGNGAEFIVEIPAVANRVAQLGKMLQSTL